MISLMPLSLVAIAWMRSYVAADQWGDVVSRNGGLWRRSASGQYFLIYSYFQLAIAAAVLPVMMIAMNVARKERGKR